MILFYVPCRNEKEAKKISQTMLKERLIACANIFPIKSFFHWKNKIQSEKEVVFIGKTTEKLKNKVEKRIKDLHPYEIPAIISFKVDANKEFISYLEKELKK